MKFFSEQGFGPYLGDHGIENGCWRDWSHPVTGCREIPQRGSGQADCPPEGDAAWLSQGRSWEESKEKRQGLCGIC